MTETSTYELFLGDLPGSVVSCWYLREGEGLTPGPLVSLRANSRAYTLLIAGADRELQGGVLQRIVSVEGAQVSRNSRLALIQLDDTLLTRNQPLPEKGSCLPTTARGQAMLFSEGLLTHPYAPLHTKLVQRSDRYRRLYRLFYPLFELGRPAFHVCLILLSWLLLRSLADKSTGDEPVLLLFAVLSFWGLLVALAGFGLLLVLASIQVVANVRQRLRWRKNISERRMKQ